MAPASLLSAISGNSFILLGVLVALVFAIAYGLYTRQGSGISEHPRPDSVDPKTDEDDLGESGDRAGIDDTESAEMDQRGVE